MLLRESCLILSNIHYTVMLLYNFVVINRFLLNTCTNTKSQTNVQGNVHVNVYVRQNIFNESIENMWNSLKDEVLPDQTDINVLLAK